MLDDKIKKIEQKILTIKNQLPAHSIPASMLLEMEDLEDQLESLRKRHKESGGGDA